MLLEYQKDVYNQLCNTLATSNCCCVIMGTGIGKTYITLEYLKEHNLNALVVSPRNSINDSWKRTCGDIVDTITYSKLGRIYDTIDFSKYNTVICDEAHHIGGAKWGIPIKYLIDNNIVKVIGLTESSIRYTDGGRDIAEEFFYNNIAIGETVSSAIEKKILNPVTYVGAMYNSDGLKKTLRGKIQSRLYAKLNLAINKTLTVSEIIKKNMPKGKRKGIIFASTINDMNFAADFIKSVYPKTVIKFLHSKQSDVINDKNMEWFKNTDEGYICSVDMISEGVHIKGVNTLIMLRRTESVNLFNQQLGRCLDASSKEPAILFDLVNNKYSLRIIKNKLHIRTNSIFDSKALNVVGSEQLIVKDYTKDIVEVLEEIQNEISGRWTEKENNLLINYYKDYPDGNGLIDFVKVNLPDRTYLACKARANALGLTTPNVIPWTDEEDDIIKKYYPEGGPKICLTYLMNRTSTSISQRAIKLGINMVTWTDEEIEILKKYYPIEGKNVINRLPNKTIYAIKGKARTLKIHSEWNKNNFTKEEIELIKKYYADNGAAYLQTLMPNHDLKEIMYKAKGLKIARKNRIKAVKCIETGKIYSPINTVTKDLSISNKGQINNIIQCCKGNRKSAYGYHWEYVEIEEEK